MAAGLRAGTGRLLDPSPPGARIQHVTPLREWSGDPLDLPDALGVLREVRRLGEREPARQAQFNAICGQIHEWLHQEIETLRFKQSH